MKASSYAGLGLSTFVIGALPVDGRILNLQQRALQPSNGTFPIISANFSNIFDIEVTIGDQEFILLFDTGSADLWVTETGYQCINGTDNTIQPQSTCMSGNTTFDIPSDFEQIPNVTFGIQYGDGIATGEAGYQKVSIGNFTVDRQIIGVVNSTNIVEDGLENGLIGFGHPILTSLHAGTNTSNDTLLLNRTTYPNWITNLYQQGDIEPYFSLALQRAADGYDSSVGPGGYVGLGIVPPVSHNNSFTTVPVEITQGIPLSYYPDGQPVISEWTTTVSETRFAGQINTTSYQAVVDAGNFFNVFPQEVSDAFNAAFDPPGTLQVDPTGQSQVYVVECDATPPSLEVVVGNTSFAHDPRDLILQIDGLCVSAVASLAAQGGLSFMFLGTPFIKNVVAVFDFGKEEMRFASTVNSTSSTITPHTSASSGTSVACSCLWLLSVGLTFLVLGM